LSTAIAPELGFRLLSTGFCREWSPLVFRRSPWKFVEFPATCAVLDHPTRGVILFDTGYSPRFFDATRTFPERGYRWATPVTLDPRGSAAQQLAGLGMRPDDVRHVIVSHFHGDHICGLKDFPRATIVYDGAGLRALSALSRFRAVRAAFLAGLLPDDLAKRSLALEHGDGFWREAGSEPAHWDLFGDGSVRLVPLPGHAPGQCGALFQSPRGRVFLIADAAWSLSELQGAQTLTALASRMHDGWDEYLATQRALRDYSRAHPDVALIPTHDADAASRWSLS
jgi:glyoxylase-like metal-dependent hydrolase (beta-lactamase superfamily II)